MDFGQSWTIDDLDEVCHILNAASPFDQFSIEHVRAAVFDDPDYDPDLLWCRRSGGDLTSVIAGVVRRTTEWTPTPVGYIKLFAVEPQYQGLGFGGALIDAMERRFVDRGATSVHVFGDTPAYLRPGVDFRLTKLICLLLRRGYDGEHSVNMEVDLARAPLDTLEDERRLLSENIEIRRLGSADAQAFAAYMIDQWGWGWQTEALRSLLHVPITCHIALRAGEIVGFAAHDVSGPGQFGPMGVRSDFRRSGIGGVLLKRCLADLRDAGYPIADIQWVGPIAFYARQVGATLSRCFWQMAKTLTVG